MSPRLAGDSHFPLRNAKARLAWIPKKKNPLRVGWDKRLFSYFSFFCGGDLIEYRIAFALLLGNALHTARWTQAYQQRVQKPSERWFTSLTPNRLCMRLSTIVQWREALMSSYKKRMHEKNRDEIKRIGRSFPLVQCSSSVPFLYRWSSRLLAREDHAGDILLPHGEGVRAAHSVTLLLESLHDREEDEGAALLAAVVLAKVNPPRGRLRVALTALHNHELGELVLALGGEARGRALGEDLLQGIDRILTEASTLNGDHRGVEDASHNNVRHDEKLEEGKMSKYAPVSITSTVWAVNVFIYSRRLVLFFQTTIVKEFYHVFESRIHVSLTLPPLSALVWKKHDTNARVFGPEEGGAAGVGIGIGEEVRLNNSQ
eukprot:gene6234-4484_t